MIVGYARTSTNGQKAGLEAQEHALASAGCEKLFVEHVSSVDLRRRDKLAEVLNFVREGDTLVVTSLDRLARSVAHLMDILKILEAKSVALRILAMGVDTGTPTGRLMLTIFAGVAEFERSIMLERQREGIAKAKAEGKYKGPALTARVKVDEVLRLRAEGVSAIEVAKRLGMSRASVYRFEGEVRAVTQAAENVASGENTH